MKISLNRKGYNYEKVFFVLVREKKMLKKRSNSIRTLYFNIRITNNTKWCFHSLNPFNSSQKIRQFQYSNFKKCKSCKKLVSFLCENIFSEVFWKMWKMSSKSVTVSNWDVPISNLYTVNNQIPVSNAMRWLFWVPVSNWAVHLMQCLDYSESRSVIGPFT